MLLNTLAPAVLVHTKAGIKILQVEGVGGCAVSVQIIRLCLLWEWVQRMISLTLFALERSRRYYR